MFIGLTIFANAFSSSADRSSDAILSTSGAFSLVAFIVLTVWGLWQAFCWMRSKLTVSRITRKTSEQVRKRYYAGYKRATFELKVCLACVLFGYVFCGACFVKSFTKGGDVLAELPNSRSVSVLMEKMRTELFVEGEPIAKEDSKEEASYESDATLDEMKRIVDRQSEAMKEIADGKSLNDSSELSQNESGEVSRDLEKKNEYGYYVESEVQWVPDVESSDFKENKMRSVSDSEADEARLLSPVLTGPLETRTALEPKRLQASRSNGTQVRNLQNEVEAASSRPNVSVVPAVQLDRAFFEAREDYEAQRRLTECFTPENPLAPYPESLDSPSRSNLRSVSHEGRIGDGTSAGLIDDIWTSKDKNDVADENEKSILVRIDEESNRISSLVRACVLPIETRKTAAGSRVVEEETGCGFLTQYKGKTYVVTNNHVVDHALSNDSIKIFLPNNRTISPKKVFPCDDFDLAALEVAPEELPKDGSVTLCRFGDSDSVRVANSVFAIGNPFGLEKSLSYGHVSSLRRCNRDLISTNQNLLPEYIQIDAAINPGNSGGPLYDSRGDVVGIVTAIATTTGKNEGVAFAIPINVALRVVKTTIDGGVWKRSRLGVELEPVTRTELAGTNLPYVFGAKIVEISAKSPAQAAGLKPGDVVLSFNGKQVENDVHLARMVALADVSEPARAGVLRGANYFEIEIKLEQATKN